MSSLLPESVEVAAGLVFVYLFMSVLATAVREAVEGIVKRRARNLEKGLIELLCDHPPEKSSGKTKKIAGYDMLKTFYDHPLIMSLYRGRYTIPPKRNFLQGGKLPSYIPSSHFAYVVLDMLAERGGQAMAGDLDPATILAATQTLDNTRLARMVQFAVNNSGGDIDKTRQFLENWFNATMDRVSGWYRNETQAFLFWLSLVTCVVLNVNTVVIADTLFRSPSLRKAVEVAAENYYQKQKEPGATPVDAAAVVADKQNPLNALGLPLGWNAQTQETMDRLFQRDPQAGPVMDESQPKPHGPTSWLDDAKASVSWLWKKTVNFYYGQPTLGDKTLINAAAVISLIMGWVMTAFAVTLGAPFWFDILSKLMAVRSALKPGTGGGGAAIDLGALTAIVGAANGASPPLTRSFQPDLRVAAVAALPAPADGGHDPLPADRPRDA